MRKRKREKGAGKGEQTNNMKGPSSEETRLSTETPNDNTYTQPEYLPEREIVQSIMPHGIPTEKRQGKGKKKSRREQTEGIERTG